MLTGHGGNIHQLAQRLGCPTDEISDMSSNLNPLGPPAGLETFLMQNTALIRSLPPVDAGPMVEAFCRYNGVEAGRVAAGNGTTWFITTLPQVLNTKHMLIMGPTYSEYKDACVMYGSDFSFCMAEPDTGFEPDMHLLSSILSRSEKTIDTVVICNPNNPTGALIDKNSIRDVADSHPGVFFVIDESYLPFVDNADAVSLVRENRYANLIVLSSMSKIFCMPGLRTGFVCASPWVIERFMMYYQPWSVNAPAQAAVAYLYDNSALIEQFTEQTRIYIKKEKQLFTDMLEDCSHLKIFPSQTCFVLAKLQGSMTSDEFCHIAAQKKILIRDCANFDGLSDQFVRFSLKTRGENARLAALTGAIMETKILA